MSLNVKQIDILLQIMESISYKGIDIDTICALRQELRDMRASMKSMNISLEMSVKDAVKVIGSPIPLERIVDAAKSGEILKVD